MTDNYPILVSGDSTMFGSGLSDDETLPWLLADELEKPVFNGARTELANALAHPAMRDTKVVIDGWTERNIRPKQLKITTIVPQESFKPFAPRNLSYLDAIGEVPSQRYSLALLGWRALHRMFRDVKVLLKGGEQPYIFLSHRMHPGELDETVSLIVERARAMKARGIDYVFLPVPAKQTLYAKDVDDYTRKFIPLLVERLRAEGVNAFDLATPLQAHKDEGLFFPYDTHWNEKGTALAARILAEEIFAE